MKLVAVLVVSLIIGLVCAGSAAQNTDSWREDAQLRAMADELARSKTLQLGNLDKPYFIQYSTDDAEQVSITGSLDGLTHVSHVRFREPRAIVRVGSYAFDNTNNAYFGDLRFGLLPVDDDYGAIRTTLWRATDALYKTALDQITRKRNALREIPDPDKTADLAPAKAVQVVEPADRFTIEQAAWEKAIRTASARFVAHPAVLSSGVRLQSIGSTYRLVNSEGSVLRMPQDLNEVQIRANGRSADGFPVWNHLFIAAIAQGELPPPDELAKLAESVATETEALAQAPLAESYSGPVLFEGEAAPEMMAQVLTDSIMLRRKPIAPPGANAPGLDTLDSVWSSRIGSKVTPEWFTAYDDPLPETYRGHKLAGHYTVDDEGVAAQRVSLVDKGVFKGFLLSRLPIRNWSGSNGHGRLPGPFGSEQTAIGNLFVETTQPLTETQLKARLIAKIKTAGLKYGVIVRRLDFPSTATLGDLQGIARQAQKNGYARTLNQPLLAYRVTPDGREELVRGFRFGEFSAKDLRDMDAASDQPYVLNYLNNGSSLNLADFTTDAVTSSVICPSLLFDSVDLMRAEKEGGAVPVVPPPGLVAKR